MHSQKNPYQLFLFSEPILFCWASLVIYPYKDIFKRSRGTRLQMHTGLKMKYLFSNCSLLISCKQAITTDKKQCLKYQICYFHILVIEGITNSLCKERSQLTASMFVWKFTFVMPILHAINSIILYWHSSRYSGFSCKNLGSFKQLFTWYSQQRCIFRKQKVTLKIIRCSYIWRQISSFSWRNYLLLYIVTYQIHNFFS